MEYDIEFEFRNFLYQQVSHYFIDIVGEKMTHAFEKRANEEMNKKTKKIKELEQELKKNRLLIPAAGPNEIIESLKNKIDYFYKLKGLNENEFKSIMEILEKNLDLKEFLIQAYIIFCKNNMSCVNGEKKFLHYVKDIVLMKNFKTVN